MTKSNLKTFFDVMKIIGLAGAIGCNTYADILDQQYEVVAEQVEVGTITNDEGAVLCQEYVDKATGQRMAVKFLLPMGIAAVLFSDAEGKKDKDNGLE